YAVGDRLRYAEARLAGRWRRYRLVAVETSEALAILIERAQAGARVAELVDALLRWDRSLEPEDAQDFVVAAIEAQLLVAELGPAVTGDAVGLDQLVRDLEAVPAAASLRRALVEVHASLSRQDAAGVGAPVEGYLAIATRLQDLPVEVELSRLFQVDLAKPAPDATLGREPLAEITRGVELLWQIGSVPRNPHLEEFRAAFFARFEEREVPLGEALDEESGIGFGGGSDRGDAAPLLDGLHFPASGRDGKGSSWQERHAQLLRRVDELRRSGGRILELDEADVRELRSPARAPLPDSFSVSATLVAASAEELRRGAFQVYLPGMMGPSGANLIGRFCYLDPQLTERVIANLRAEEAQRPDAIFAEIVHLPEGRVGNLVMRPRLRTHEIAFLGRSGAPPQQQIPLGDLSVLLDRGRIVLRSRRLGCEIIPRLTTAHNFVHGQNLGVYRFLCALQHQGVTAALGWSWGPLESAPFLPRVTSGRLVLALARWRIAGACLHAVGAASDAETLERMRALRAERGIPRLAALEDGDNVLPLDLDNILVVRSLLQLVARRPFVTLTEWFPEPAQACAHGPEGRYAHELIIPFESRRPSAPAAVRPRAATAAAATTRSLPPGSEWLYLKLFTGTATADRLLREMIAPTVRWATTAGATGWFFIRYDEHGHHLRLRVRGEPSWLLSELLPRLTEATRPWRDGGLIWRMQIDTYERELERYGGARGIELAESLFRADSEAVLRQLEIVGADGGGDLRWQLALAGVDRLLADFALSPSEKHDLARRLRADVGNEFRADVTLSRELGDKFRRLRPQLEALLDEDATGPGIETLRARSAEVRPLVGELRARHERRELGVSPAELA
ncbi:MAG TPA: lantibiotic dehydratase, partial [Polyangia bacterium]